MTTARLSDWEVEGLRLSAFLVDAPTPSHTEYWETLVGVAPNERLNRPAQHLTKEEGPFLDGWLSMEAVPNRIDWRWGINPRSITRSLPSIGPYAELEPKFAKLMENWAALCPNAHRFAYGAALLLPAESLSQAHLTLDEMLQLNVDVEGTSDFQYRINRRRRANCLNRELMINRLSTWSAGEIAVINVDVSSSTTPKVSNVVGGAVCRLELDINTAPEFQEIFSGDEATLVFAEMIELAHEIALHGDVP